MNSFDKFSHLDEQGRSGMVDVGEKKETQRVAVAEARVVFPASAFSSLLDGANPKGSILEVARIAGIQAAKQTSTLIPMCHNLNLNKVSVDIIQDSGVKNSLLVICEVSCEGKTGVEMEAMVGASMAALTVYDMTKSLDKGILIEKVVLKRKSGGNSGEYRAQ